MTLGESDECDSSKCSCQDDRFNLIPLRQRIPGTPQVMTSFSACSCPSSPCLIHIGEVPEQVVDLETGAILIEFEGPVADQAVADRVIDQLDRELRSRERIQPLD